jgi:hypothetical protein
MSSPTTQLDKTDWNRLDEVAAPPEEWLQILFIAVSASTAKPLHPPYQQTFARRELNGCWRRLLPEAGKRFLDENEYRVDYWRLPPK